MTTLHTSTFEYLKPTDGQAEVMNSLRKTTADYAATIDQALDNGPDKIYILRRIRETAMWINVALTRNADGSPRRRIEMTEYEKAEARKLLEQIGNAEKIHPAGSPEHAQIMQYALAVAWPRLRCVLQSVTRVD